MEGATATPGVAPSLPFLTAGRNPPRGQDKRPTAVRQELLITPLRIIKALPSTALPSENRRLAAPRWPSLPVSTPWGPSTLSAARMCVKVPALSLGAARSDLAPVSDAGPSSYSFRIPFVESGTTDTVRYIPSTRKGMICQSECTCAGVVYVYVVGTVSSSSCSARFLLTRLFLFMVLVSGFGGHKIPRHRSTTKSP